MLQRLCILREEIATFLDNKRLNATRFRNQERVFNLIFSVDLTSHLNNLNFQLQVDKAPIDT